MSVKVYRCHPDAIMPERKSPEAAGYDICSIEDFWLEPGSRVIVRTGLVVQPPPGYHTEIFARSGNAAKYGVMLTNNIGLVDRDYAGPEDEIKVMLYMSKSYLLDFSRPHLAGNPPSYIACGRIGFKKGDRIAQLVFRKTELFDLEEVSSAPGIIDRGGLGSTGKR